VTEAKSRALSGLPDSEELILTECPIFQTAYWEGAFSSLEGRRAIANSGSLTIQSARSGRRLTRERQARLSAIEVFTQSSSPESAPIARTNSRLKVPMGQKHSSVRNRGQRRRRDAGLESTVRSKIGIRGWLEPERHLSSLAMDLNRLVLGRLRHAFEAA